LLLVRLRPGIAEAWLEPEERERAVGLAKEGLLTRMHGRFVLTRQGRLLADLIVRRLAA
jgi:hypothetical protein